MFNLKKKTGKDTNIKILKITVFYSECMETEKNREVIELTSTLFE